MTIFGTIRGSVKRLIFGDNQQLRLERKIQILLTFLTSVMVCFGMIFNILVNMNFWMTLLTAVSSVLIIIFFLIARNSDKYQRTIIPLFISSVVFLSAAWLLNAGYDGNIMTLMFVFFLMLYVIVPQKYRKVVFGMFIAMILILVPIQYYHPELVIGYDNNEQRFADMLFSNLFYLILFYYLIDVIVKSYVRENTKTALINDELQKKNAEIAENIARLEISEAKYHQLYSLQRLMSDTMPDMIWAKDLDKHYLFANKAMCDTLLIASDTAEPVGKNDLFFAQRQRALHPENPEWHTFGEICMDTDDTTIAEMREMQFNEYGNVQGKFLFLDVHKAPLFDNEGKLIGVVGSARDVTDQKKIEERLHLSHHAIESFTEFLTITDLNDRFTYVNQAFVDAYGYSREEILGRTPAILWSKNNSAGLLHEILGQSKVGSWTGEVRNVAKDGREFLISLSTSQVKDRTGKIIGLVGISKDITDQKRAEELLKASEERQRFILESMPVAIYSSPVDPDHDTTWISGDVQRITGFSIEEYLSAPDFWRVRLHPDDRDAITASYTTMAVNGEMIHEYRWKCKDGQYRWFQDRTSLREKQGKKEFLGILVDITEKKRAEEDVIRALSILESTMESTADGILVVDGKGNIVHYNAKFRQMWGIPDPILAMKDDHSALQFVMDQLHDPETFLTSVRDLYAVPERISFDILSLKNGRIFERYSQPQWIGDGVTGRVWSFRDVTERNRAQDELLYQKNLLNTIIESTTQAIFAKNIHGVYQSINGAGGRMLGLDPSDIIGRTDKDILSSETAKEFRQTDERVLSTGHVIEREELGNIGGKTITFLAHKSPWRDTAGNIIGVIGVTNDITDRKDMERKLRENESRYRGIIENLHQAYYEADSRSVITYCNSELFIFSGYTEEEMIGTSALRYVVEEHRQRVSDAYGQWKKGLNDHTSIEFITKTKSGQTIWVEQSTYFEFDDQGRFVKGVNIVKNIEQRKAAETALINSEIFFRSVWQHSASGMRITDVYGTVIRANTAYCEMVGKKEKEIVGTSFSVIYAEDDRSRIVQKHTERFQSRTVPAFAQKKLILWNGATIWVEVSNSFLELGDSQILLLGVFADVTTRKRSELALMESEDRWQFALEGAGDGVWDWNCATNEVLFSHNLKAMLGYSDEEMGSSLDEWSKRIHPDDAKRVTEDLHRHFRKEIPLYQNEHRLLCKDGTYKWIFDRGKVFEWTADGKPLRMIGTHTDVAELKKSEQIIRDLQRRESIGVLAGGIAHDFNNLLTAIIGNVSLAQLRMGEDHPVIQQNLERAMNAAERAATLSKQMLAYSGKGKFQFIQIDLNHMVDECIGLFEASLPKNVTIVKHLSPQPVFVKGDPGQIEQIVMNLIINAGEAVGTKNGAVNISVVTMTMTDEMVKPFTRLNNQALHGGDYAMFQVTDTGIGMDSETLAKIFDPFFTTKFVGRGLGLSAVLGIIRGHNGGITVTSKENDGTIFQVLLPLVSGEVQQELPAQSESIVREHVMTILVIDDEQYIIDMTKDVLERGQYRFHTAVDPEIGLKIFAEHWRSIDLVILDYSMPKLNGKEVLLELRKINPAIKVIMSSGYSEEELDHLMGDVKPSVFIQKPHRPQTLLSMISTMLDTL